MTADMGLDNLNRNGRRANDRGVEDVAESVVNRDEIVNKDCKGWFEPQ